MPIFPFLNNMKMKMRNKIDGLVMPINVSSGKFVSFSMGLVLVLSFCLKTEKFDVHNCLIYETKCALFGDKQITCNIIGEYYCKWPEGNLTYVSLVVKKFHLVIITAIIDSPTTERPN